MSKLNGKSSIDKKLLTLVVAFFVGNAWVQVSEAHPCDFITASSRKISEEQKEIRAKEKLYAHAKDKSYLYNHYISQWKLFFGFGGTVFDAPVVFFSIQNWVNVMKSGARLSREGGIVLVSSTVIFALALYTIYSFDDESAYVDIHGKKQQSVLAKRRRLGYAVKEYMEELYLAKKNYNELYEANLKIAQQYGCYIPPAWKPAVARVNIEDQ